MNAQSRTIKLYLILVFFAAMLAALTSCASAAMGAVEVGIEPTPTPTLHSYVNDFYGFAFEYPDTWSLTEEDHGVVLKKGANRLGINFRWIHEDYPANFGRTGFGGGTLIYSDKIDFMGEIVPGNTLELDHLAKAYILGDSALIEVDDLAFSIVLEDLITDYMSLNLSDDVIAEAKTIITSFKRIQATGSPEQAAPTPEPPSLAFDPLYPDRPVYENREYGFAFCYSPLMSISEEPNKVLVNDGTAQLTIAYRRPQEDIRLSDIDRLEGQYQPILEFSFLGVDERVFENTFDGILKNVYFGDPGVEIGRESPLRFNISLTDTSGGELSETQIDEMFQVVQCFGLTNE